MAQIDEHTASRVAELFGALSDTTRVRIIAALAGGELNVRSIADAIGLSESAVSHQLRGLRHLHLVQGRKAGRRVYYSLEDDHIAELYQRGLDHVRHG